MGFLDKVKAGAEQAATKAREGVADVQTKRDLGTAYSELGTKTFELADAGSVSHPELEPLVERIRTLRAQLEQGGEGSEGEPAAAEPAPSDKPPAMPL